ncbi:putative MFS multidrug transporter [Talaromyces proteolyticus]|uniref:MFS multidrug transporter n=1 Tax=Talaromyces proteolyticus TaxID=1131652 RepID=A0AAD4L345_9EURO|nr:putative MFS multidrug transporter [Talaromyces proteolyticus]KAH8703333.1 putative MFS multidrug transporter [Talaromyces proteolyticus]
MEKDIRDHSNERNESREEKEVREETKDLERGSTPSEKAAQLDEDTPETRDPNLVDWNGPDDPQNPMNWPLSRKLVITVTISVITLLTPLGSSMFAPGVPDVMQDFKSDNIYLASFVVSVYLLGYCFGPLLIAPLSEMYGRTPLYNACNILYTIFSVACAVAPNMGGLIIFRFFAGLAGSCPLTLGAGSLADMIPKERRGAAMAAWALGPLLGPVIGPVAGGYLTQAKGWRWTFWVLAIAGGAVSVISLIFMRESYAYVLLDRKAKRLRKETGNENLRSVLDTGRSPKDLFIFSIVRPTKMLFLSPIVFLLSLYVAIIYGYLYLLFTTMTDVFEGQYGFSQGSVGLAYLGIGCGSIIGLFVCGMVSDRLLQYLTKKNGGVAKPEYRLPPMFITAWTVPLALFWYGWTAEKHVHWILPILGTACLGVGMLMAFMCTSTYLVDAYTIYAASAVAANTVFRSLLGALLPLAGNKMYDSLGLGWGNSVLGFIALALAPLPFVFYSYGERIRNSKLFHVEF